jgi:hypothetical protein
LENLSHTIDRNARQNKLTIGNFFFVSIVVRGVLSDPLYLGRKEHEELHQIYEGYEKSLWVTDSNKAKRNTANGIISILIIKF